jgi:hypothetical protein
MEQTKLQISTLFATKDLGESKWILGVKVHRQGARTIELSQTALIQKAVEKFPHNVRPFSTPMDPDWSWGIDSPKVPDDKRQEYQALIGTLLYIARFTRPDVLTAVARLCRFASAPTEDHVKSAQRVLAYLNHTKLDSLIIGGDPENLNLHAFVDADWAGDIIDRKSTTGYILYLGNSPIIWRSAKQDSTSLSTMEAEYIAFSECAKDVLWTQGLLRDLRICYQKPTRILCDNQAALSNVIHETNARAGKHIEIRHHFVRQHHETGTIVGEYVPSSDNLADAFTKPLPRPKFEAIRAKLGMISKQFESEE